MALPAFKQQCDSIYSQIFVPLLAELTNELGILHTANLVDNMDGKLIGVKITREPRGFFSWFYRMIGWWDTVIWMNVVGELWCVHYYSPYYFITAQTIKELYNEKFKKQFGRELVILEK
jgi:hypothetical protein